MNKFLQRGIAFFLAVLLYGGSVSAQELVAAYRMQSHSVSAYGVSGEKSSQAVNLVVIKKGESPGSGNPVSVNVTKTKEGGEYDAVILLPEELSPGEYELYATSALLHTSQTFFIPDREEAERILEEVNRAGSAEQVRAVLEESYAALGLFEEEYRGAGDISPLVFGLRKEGGYQNAAELLDACRGAYAQLMIQAGRKQEEMLHRYETELGIDYEEDFASLENKELVLQQLSRQEYGQRPFVQIYEEVCLLAEIVGATSWVLMKQTILQNAGRLDIDISGGSAYAALNYSDGVFRSLFSNKDGLQTLEDVKEIFDALVYQAGLDAAGSSGSSGGSGGGGSGGRGSGGGKTVMNVDPTLVHTENQSSTSVFSDLEGHWAKEIILELEEEGAVHGYEDGTFRPDEPVTRAEFLTLIQALAQFPAAEDPGFEDVEEGSWYYPYISAFAAKGVAWGYEGKFQPQALITRQDAAVLLFRTIKAAGMELAAEETVYEEDLAGYAVEAVSALAAAGILQGDGTSFGPLAHTTRAEAAAMLQRALLLAQGEGETTYE